MSARTDTFGALGEAPLAVDEFVSRAATPEDAPRIAEIYNEGIADRIATFEIEPRTAADIGAWFARPYPIVVVEVGGQVSAFAALSRYRDRACYAGIAEFSVYVAREARGQGLGHAAMSALLAAAEAAGFWKLVSRVFVENEGSRRLLRRIGFREVGVYEKHGKLDGIWRDVMIVEYLIPANLDRPDGPLPPPGQPPMTPSRQASPASEDAAGETGWTPDRATLAAWHELIPGRTIDLAKLDPAGRETARYTGRVARVVPDEQWVEVEARWTTRSITSHGLDFQTGDVLREFFSPVLPFNAFAVYGSKGDVRGWYANVTYPALLDMGGETPRLIWHDLYLDVIAFPDGSFVSVDDDELESSGLARENPALHARIVAARDDLIRRLQSRQRPFAFSDAEAAIDHVGEH